MNERSLEVLEQYDLEVQDVFHGRGSFICRTDKGRKLLYPFNGSENRAALLYSLQMNRKESGERFVDIPLKNKEEEFVSEDMYGNRFILKDWVEMPEWDINDIKQLSLATKGLAVFHKAFRLKGNEVSAFEKFTEKAESFSSMVEKRNREISKVYKYIRLKNNKTDFEFSFLRVADFFLEQGRNVAKELENGVCDRLLAEAKEKGIFGHGDFSQHEVILFDGQAHVIHPEHFVCLVQTEDLAHIMRKVLEKNDWDINTGMAMIEAYDKEKTLSEDEKRFLYLRLSYPEKFRKLANRYYNSKKTWIAVRQEEKLARLIEQDKKKSMFLEEISN